MDGVVKLLGGPWTIPGSWDLFETVGMWLAGGEFERFMGTDTAGEDVESEGDTVERGVEVLG